MEYQQLLAASPEQQQMLLAETLRRRRAQAESMQGANEQANRFNTLAAVAQMANNPGAAAAAQLAMKNAQAQHKPINLGAQGFALPSSGEFVESPMYADEKAAAREQQRLLLQATLGQREQAAAQQADIARERIAAQREQAAMRNSLGQTMAEIARMRAEGRGEKADAAAQAKVDKDTNAALAKYTAALEKGNVPAIMSGIQNINSVFDKYPAGKDIPGYGAMTNALPNFLIGEEGKNNRVQMQMTANQILRGLSGQAVTGQENQRFLTAVGQGVGMSDGQLRLGWANVLDELNQKRRNFNTMLTPQQMDEYRARGGNDYTDYSLPKWAEDARTKNRPKTAAGAAPKGGRAPAGVDQLTWDHMTPEERSLWAK